MKYQITNIKHNDFPEKLKNIKKSPQKLYTIGNIELLYEDSFAIVGTRKPTEYGVRISKEFANEFALRNIPIVSGMAEGIDEISHKIAIENQSGTIAVLGSGFYEFLNNKEKYKIFYEIIENGGLVISEYDLTVEKRKENFPNRNRIIAGLSEGVLVIEAGFRSGSSITARYAKEYGKRVFAVPGRIGDKMSVGTNNLIKKGAILSTSAEELLTNYPQFANKKRKTIHKKSKIKENIKIKEEWKEIIDILEDKILSIEELQFKTGKSIRELMKDLSEMEIYGIIKQEIGTGYFLK